MQYDPTAFSTKDWVTIAALFLGPVFAVLLTFWKQARDQKYAAKERLFVTLMSHRRASPPPPDWCAALNLIDVVFAGHPKVIGLWHQLYQVVETKPWNDQRYTHTKLELLSEMAKVLGYKNLAQTDIDKFYYAEGLGVQAKKAGKIQDEFLRVLRASKNMAEGRQPHEIPVEKDEDSQQGKQGK